MSGAALPLRGVLALVLLALAGLPALAHAADETISLGVGTQKVIQVPGGISRIAVGDPGVADVKPLGTRQVPVVGGSEGRTTLLIWRSNGRRDSYLIVVRKVSAEETVGEVRRLLGEREGISIRTVGDRIFLDGEAFTADDYRRVEQIVDLYPNVRSFVKVSPGAKKIVATNLNSAFAKAGLKNVTANVIGSTIFLEGSVESKEDLDKADRITRAIGEKVENLLGVGIKRMILSEVQFVEVRRAGTDAIGVRWPLDLAGSMGVDAQVEGPLPSFLPIEPSEGRSYTTGGYGATAQVASPLSLRAAMDDGFGRLLAQPKLVCASGESAEFLAGGEVPIPIVTAMTTDVEFKQYGIILKIKPTADRQGNIQTEIEAEVSELDRSVAVAIGSNISVPGFRNRKVRTNVTVRHGETIVLSGVFSHDEQKSVAKTPLLGHIPIFGELFKQRAFEESKRELIIFVTPRIVNPDTERIRKLISDMKGRYKQAKEEVSFGIFD